VKMQAVAKLGEVDGVDAFKKRSEITHQIKPIEEVEKELLTVLEGIEYSVIEDKTAPLDSADSEISDQNASIDA
jgi:predicted transcriptional regulator